METLIEKSVPFEVKVELSTREFEGYASTFGNMDLVGDIIEHGAFRKTITERGPRGANKIKILWEHREAFGMPVDLHEDPHGLFVVGKASDTQENKDRLTYMADGVVDSMSIGFTIPEGKSWWEEADDAPFGMVRHITEAKLYEFSPVSFPANEEAAISNVRKHLEMQNLLKSFGREDLAGLGRELKSLDSRIIDEALSALEELKATLSRAGALPVSEPEPEAEGDTGEPLAGDVKDTDPEVTEALQSVLDELRLDATLIGIRGKSGF